MGGAVVVQFHTHGVDARRQVAHRFLVPRILACAQTVEGGIEAEHDDLHPAALGGQQGHLGIVAAEAYMLDFTLFLQLEDIVEEWRVLYLLPLLTAVGDMYHAHLDMVGAQTCEEVLKPGLGGIEVAGACVLPVGPNGADMALDNHLVTTALEGVADIGARLGVGVIDVDVVHAAVESHRHQLKRCRAVEFLKASAADAYLAHHQARVAQWPELHVGLFLLLLAAYGHKAERG